MMSLTFGLFTQVSGSGPLGSLVCRVIGFVKKSEVYLSDNSPKFDFISADFS